MNPTDYAVSELLPHTGAMVLLDRVLEYRDHGLSAEVTVRGDVVLFGDSETVPAWAGLEYMAQTIGAYVGIQAKLAGEPIRLGFLLGTRRYESNVGEFKVGARLMVSVEKIIQDAELGVFECRIRGDNIVIDANLNVYQPRAIADTAINLEKTHGPTGS